MRCRFFIYLGEYVFITFPHLIVQANLLIVVCDIGSICPVYKNLFDTVFLQLFFCPVNEPEKQYQLSTYVLDIA